MLVGIRVDASAAMGLGHVKRCLSLAQALRDIGVESHFVVRPLGVDVASDIEALNFACTALPAPVDAWSGEEGDVAHAAWAAVPWTVDTQDTVQALSHLRLDWLLIDHYAFDARWHRAVGQQLGARVAVIDDLGDRDLAADLVIDHNHAVDHRLKYRGLVADDVPILGGPTYALLGAAYRDAKVYSFQREVRSIGIFMGGADAGNVSAMALQACREDALFTGPIEIVTTHGNPNARELVALAERWPGTSVLFDQPDLAGFFSRHDLQVGAGGGATWERCCVGVPTLAIIVADNQRRVLDPLQSLHVLCTVTALPMTQAALGSQVRFLIDNPEVRENIGRCARALVDGQGASRVAHYMKAS